MKPRGTCTWVDCNEPAEVAVALVLPNGGFAVDMPHERFCRVHRQRALKSGYVEVSA